MWPQRLPQGILKPVQLTCPKITKTHQEKRRMQIVGKSRCLQPQPLVPTSSCICSCTESAAPRGARQCLETGGRTTAVLRSRVGSGQAGLTSPLRTDHPTRDAPHTPPPTLPPRVAPVLEDPAGSQPAPPPSGTSPTLTGARRHLSPDITAARSLQWGPSHASRPTQRPPRTARRTLPSPTTTHTQPTDGQDRTGRDNGPQEAA